MPYPFQPNMKDMEETSYRLKIMAVAGNVTVSEICRQIVNHIFEQINSDKLDQAKEQIGEQRWLSQKE